MTAWWDGPGLDESGNTPFWAQSPIYAQPQTGYWGGWWDESYYIEPSTNNGGGGGGSNNGGNVQPPPTPTPDYGYIAPSISAPPPDPTTFAVRQPAPSLVQYNIETLPQQVMEDLLYQQVGGQELINIARHDTIDGQNVIYSLISNLAILNKNFNPNNILAGQSSYNLQLKQYALDIADKLPYVSDDYPYGAVYLNADGDLVIEFTSIDNDEIAEIEISTSGTIYRLGVA